MDLLRAHLNKARIPEPTNRIPKDECCVSFDTPTSDGGLYVDMSSFLGFGREYVEWNYEKTGNPVYLHIVQRRKPEHDEADRPSKKPTLLAIECGHCLRQARLLDQTGMGMEATCQLLKSAVLKRSKKYKTTEIAYQFKILIVITLDKTIASLETELSAARSLQESLLNGSPVAEEFKISESIGRRKYLMVIGINTAFSSRKRRDSIRYTWMPQGENRRKLEEGKGIIIRFVIGHSS